jgi:RimJ/RimL family protein N-acetyltransferase
MTGRRVLRTARLALTPIGAGDVAQLHAHWDDARVARPRCGAVPEDTVRELVAASDRDFARAGHGLWALRHTATGPIVGTCGLRGSETPVELLFSLDPDHRGRGLATEAARAVLDHAVVVGAVVAFTDADDAAAQRLLTRLGMTPCDFTTAPLVRWRLGGCG